MIYQDELKAHLVRYKERVLGIREPGIRMRRGVATPYAHVLPSYLANLLPEAGKALEQYRGDHPTPSRHSDFAHLNSSQAFSHNLFLPYFGNSQPSGAAMLLSALDQPGPLLKWELESVTDPDERTSFDVVWSTAATPRVYCEVKLSETEFGRASKQTPDRIDGLYRERLSQAVDEALFTPSLFRRHYQLLRNLSYVARDEQSRLVLLVPRANTRVWNQATKFLLQVAPKVRARVTLIAIEDLLDRLVDVEEGLPGAHGYAGRLRDKYVLPHTLVPQADC